MVAFNGLNNGAGTERVCSMIANGLSEAGNKIVLGSIRPSNKPFFPINKDIEIISLLGSESSPSSISNIAIGAYKIRRILKEEKIDTVIAVDTMSVQFTLPATVGLKIQHIAWEHFNFNPTIDSKRRFVLRKLAARYCDSVIVLTERDKEYWLKNTRHKSQIKVIANPCPFVVQEDIEKKENLVLAVGRLHSQKGFDLLLKSWIEVVKIMPDWKLKIVGEGIERANLTEFIEKNRINDSVELVGASNDISQYYSKSKIFCLSSRVEAFGMVLTEALAFGLPIVSFDCGPGPAEVLKDTGSILVPKNDINQFACSLINLMKDSTERKIISLKGKEKAKIYQPENIINQWVSLLESFK